MLLQEQFCTDWDYIDYAAGDQVNGHRIAGNYDAHTNVWGVGLVSSPSRTTYEPCITIRSKHIQAQLVWGTDDLTNKR